MSNEELNNDLIGKEAVVKTRVEDDTGAEAYAGDVVTITDVTKSGVTIMVPESDWDVKNVNIKSLKVLDTEEEYNAYTGTNTLLDYMLGFIYDERIYSFAEFVRYAQQKERAWFIELFKSPQTVMIVTKYIDDLRWEEKYDYERIKF